MRKELSLFFFLFSFISCAQTPETLDFLLPSNPHQAILNYARNKHIDTPSATQETALIQFISDLDAAGIWAVTDACWMRASNGPVNFTDINLKNPGTYTALRINNPTFIRNGGLKNNGVNSYVNTQWAPNYGGYFTQNSGEVIIYYKDISTGLNFVDGCRETNATNATFISPSSAASQAFIKVNGSGAAFSNDAQFTTSDGLYFFGRTNSTTEFAKKDNGSRVTTSVTSTGRTQYPFFVGNFNQGGAPSSVYNARNHMVHWIGGLLTTTQEGQFKTAWETYKAVVDADAPLSTLGSLYNETSWTDLSDFTNNGATVNVVANDLQFSGGANNYAQTLGITRYTSLERWEATITVSCDEKTATSRGFGFGIHSTVVAPQNNDVIGWFNMTSGAGSGVSTITTSYTGTYTDRASTSALSFSAGDVIELTVERNKNVVSVSTRNVTTASGTVTNSFTFGPAAAPPVLPNCGFFSVFSKGGQFTVQSWSVSSDEITGGKYCWIGDSKSVGYGATNLEDASSRLLGDYIGQGVVLAGASERTADALARVQEAIDVNASIYILVIGSNDPRFGVSTATTTANFDAIVTALQGAGKTVLLTTGMYEPPGIDQTPLQSHINSTYSSSIVWDSLPTVLTIADGVHPNTAGYITFINAFIASNKLPTITY